MAAAAAARMPVTEIETYEDDTRLHFDVESDLYSPRNDPQIDPEMIPTFLLVDPEMIPREVWNGDETWDCGLLNN